MKPAGSDDQDNTIPCPSDANWLGFSLSPHMKMDTSVNRTTLCAAGSPNFVHNEPQQVNYGVYFGATDGHHHDGSCLYSPLPVMPLKSDGSLCIMEALSSSHTQAATCSPPKLEDFFGGTSIGAHHFETSGREAMALSLDRYYQQQTNPTAYQNQQYYNYSYFRSHEMLPEEHKDVQLSDFNLHLPNDGAKMVVNAETGPDVGAMGYGNLKSLSLSMSPGSQSSCVTGNQQISQAVVNCPALEISKKRSVDKVDQKQIVHRKSLDTFGQRTSQYRGVTRHRWTGRYEAHLWDNSCKKEGQSRKGRQVYLGGYDMEDKAARAYDLAALKYWGPSTHINFPLENYQKEIEEMKNMSRQEYVAHLRRKSSGFSRGASIYRGVTRHHQHGRWQARIGRVAGNKDLYLGTFSTQEEAAEAYDIAAIKFRGVNAVTNFDITRYDVERIMASNTLLSGDVARRNKDVAAPVNDDVFPNATCRSSLEVAIPFPKSNQTCHPDWKTVLYHSSQQLDHKAHEVDENYRSQAFSLGTDNEVGIVDYMHSMMDDAGKMSVHLSNPSSLVTSLDNSREGSPDRGNLSMRAASSSTSKMFACNGNSNAASWIIPSAQPAVSLPPIPVFAAWADS